MDIIYSGKCLEYGAHRTENPIRVRQAAEKLKSQGYKFQEPEPVEEKHLLKAHSAQYIQDLKEETIADPDTPAIKDIYKYATLAAGGAIEAAETHGFSLMRPPGHHAGINGAALGATTRGFCYLNNIAIAVKHLNQPTLILDIDGHHGNGTQEILQNSKKYTYISLHLDQAYPHTGHTSTENIHNYPLPHDCGEEIYLKTLDKALETINLEEFNLLAVSAGFDTHQGDLASMGLTENTYNLIGQRIASLNLPTFYVLEGGYRINLGKNITTLLEGYSR
jgi:acetoin utilization deacetylase AcuC-like enzyme